MRSINQNILITFCLLLIVRSLTAEDGHQLWLRNKVTAPVKVICKGHTPTLDLAVKELQQGWQGDSNKVIELKVRQSKEVKGDGFIIDSTGVQANNELGILYGVYEVLRRQEIEHFVEREVSNPSYDFRVLNHWDNLDGTIERGYAGKSIFWRSGKDSLVVTEQDKELWKEYARANASIGINGAVLNNVNSSPQMLDNEIIKRVKAIAEVLRPYGIRTYLSVNFSSPAVLGGLKTSDPFDESVIAWWKTKIKEIYTLVPDFGGFLVKANSEGQPGPQDFGRTHADGANMLAEALEPYDGIVMWRAFVYSSQENDRARQAYAEFMPFDGKFNENVIIQVKNGPVDFQPREPFNPLFGAMEKTEIMPELQITQEYLGHSEQLVFLATMWEEFFKSDTYQKGKGSTIARCTDGSIYQQKHTAIAGVANIGMDTNWCGHEFAQANWYAFGRLAWNNKLTSSEIADEWLRLTFGNQSEDINEVEWNAKFLIPVKKMMLESREAVVNYMMPLGLHHIFAGEHHYGPGPWYAPEGIRPDWTPPYYHQADTNGIGFNRTSNGSNAISQYHEPLSSQYNNLNTCPEIYLLWFHHVRWEHTMKNGQSLWDALCSHYDKGVKQVRVFQKVWDKVESYVDEQRFKEVQSKLRRQCRDAQIWKDACILYFQQFSKLPIPYHVERPIYDLNYLESIDPLTYKVKITE